MKMASQRFCLRWNNHQSNLLSVFDQLLHAETFTDVTLAVDGQYLKAHKMVLSACSPYFNALFVHHPEKHPIVILKDVPYSDMKSLLDFMYRGEVSVDQERLTAFLRVAESLRIKGLTEVNDDKPSPVAPTPPPPQLQRIQPYLVQQQQHQRSKSQNSLLAGSNAGAGGMAGGQTMAGGQHTQQQQSLLSSALASMPKRKRGRPRKLSGSSNGTGNDYDEFERDGMMNDSEMGDCKMGDSYSGNDDASDDNQRDGGDMRDPSESRDSVSHSKKFKSKDNKSKQNENDNSTSVQLINASPELSQRLFGLMKPAVTVQPQQQQPAQKDSNESAVTQTSLLQCNEPQEVATHLPTVLGLKVRNAMQLTASPLQQQQQQQSGPQNSNSLLKQQLRAGLKEISNNASNEAMATGSADFSCSALQSLASVAERQTPNAIQPPSANNLHHQFLLHMAANPMLKPTADFFRQPQQQEQTTTQDNHQQQSQGKQPQTQSQLLQHTAAVQPTQLLEQELQREDSMSPTNMDLILDHTDKSEPELTLADETAGLEYKNNDISQENNEDAVAITTITIGDGPDNETLNAQSTTAAITTTNARTGSTTRRPAQRRRIRRKAQSTIDDQAEHLTEMSVRGLDLFRYARINEGVYQCTECAKEDLQKTFKNKYSFQRHAFLYHEGKVRKVFPCTLCGKEFSRPDKMKNHLKMAHENFVARDTSSFNPLNYLITAATAEEMQTAIFTASAAAQQQQQQHQKQQQRTIGQDDYLGNGVSIVNTTQRDRGNSRSTSPNAAAALLKSQNELTIKNEIVISPSPSPEPNMSVPRNGTAPSALAVVTKSTNMSVLQAKRITQRLEEVN
ncbi:PREDICTED: protein tramtrack, alpha isoform isoform X1 [Bactrocera latifrons]|uniref:protein tramtrack, alpha isoform isoform X1 n=1 Tax=Bactrocera latifrons TaxID=174628 RepID=UPI0008DD3F93|nr:PREDICTED: protein tramtrack, alpha isoform isoform X1 [Bactrocera latifrons]XP_018801390.1 PREDICTED: protein tramtrack, alpha isoform isoform X1 [Bactrocera latifrons]XP_018801391.1 PREDICTED: protein tramtrack, alpha isoform isoform X1 [Bactrocera latifrons]XP_018801392.1 PREDICTED: protein tramtrack, alpha isoform isoform X1 [Bactrocera latifrons]